MRHSGAIALVLACAASCLAEEYSITKSFEEDQGDTIGGSFNGGRGGTGNGGTMSPGGEGGEDTGGGGSTGGSTSGSGGGETGGSSQGGSSAEGGTGGSTMAGRGGIAGGGRGGAGSGGMAGGGGKGGKGGQGGAEGAGAAGAPTGGSGGTTGCTGACIVHRYAFSGTNTTATDSVGTAHGTIMGGAQAGGAVVLAGGITDQYVSFPASVLTGITNVTLEFWVTWNGGTSNWERVFDFGSNDAAAAGEQGSTNTSSSYFFFTTRAQATNNPNCMVTTASLPRAVFTLAGPASETCVSGTAAFPTSVMTHVAVTIQGTTLSLYMNGAASGAPATLPGTLTDVTKTNNWLGRSQFTSDVEFAGSIHEFRVYGVARSAAQLAASYAAGADTVPTQ